MTKLDKKRGKKFGRFAKMSNFALANGRNNAPSGQKKGAIAQLVEQKD